MFAAVKATLSTVKIAQKEFPDIHNGHNIANAFRHALWNLLIPKESLKFNSHLDEILNWTKRITDWHEEFSPNKEMEKLMDLYNNKFGRDKFLILKEESTENSVIFLKNEFPNALKIKQKSDFKKFENKLVYLED